MKRLLQTASAARLFARLKTTPSSLRTVRLKELLQALSIPHSAAQARDAWLFPQLLFRKALQTSLLQSLKSRLNQLTAAPLGIRALALARLHTKSITRKCLPISRRVLTRAQSLLLTAAIPRFPQAMKTAISLAQPYLIRLLPK